MTRGKRGPALASNAAAVRPIEARSVVEQVTTELRRSILSGALAPGQEFALREIAGMRSLESEGLVVTRPGRSAIVTPLDLDDLRGIYRLRRQLEPEIAARAAALLSEAELDRLDQDAASFGDPDRGIDEIYESHHRFHMALLAPASSDWDMRVLKTLWRAAERYIRIGFGRLDPEPAEHSRRERSHHDLVGTFRTRDPDAVAHAMHQHLNHNEHIAMRALDLVPEH